MRRIAVRRVLVGGTAVVLAGVAAWLYLMPDPESPADEPVINITYPYTASAERERQIRANFERVVPGMTATEVRDALGSPDEAWPLFAPQVLRAPRIGTTYWYFLERPSAGRNIGTRAVRVALDMDERVTKVDHWGLDTR